MKKHPFKRALSLFMCVVMLLCSVPLAGFVGIELPSLFGNRASAVNTTYNATAAAEYARRYALNYNKEWYFYVNGGDCANFVSQSLFMGGMPMTARWHSYDGNTYAYLMDNDYVWIRCHDLMYYLISIGGERIDNPSASDFEIGDAVFYDWNLDGKINHSAVVTDIVNGVPKVSCHSTPEQASRLNAHWTLGRSSKVVTLVKLHGEKCTKNSSPNYDYYLVHTSTGRYTAPGGDFLGTAYARNTVRVTETTTYAGKTWGKYNYKGTWCWIDLSKTTYKGHRDRIQVNHLLGSWYVIQEANCLQKGIERRDCQRCEYYETREFGLGDHVPGAAATCTTAQYCTVCGETLVPALGHDMSDWMHHEDGTCVKKATEIRVCLRANDKTEIRDKDYGDHNFTATVTNPTCTDDGASVLKCSYCGLTKIDESKNQWTTTWTTADAATIASLDKNLYKARTEYRYRDKSYTESTASSLDGWNSNGWYWSDYGSWSDWTSSAITGSDSRQVETRGGSYLWGYNMTCYNTLTTGGKRQFRNYSLANNLSAYGLSTTYGEHHYTLGCPLGTLESAQTVAPGEYVSNTNMPGTNKSSETGYVIYDGVNELVYFKESEIWENSTEYRYRDRYPIYKYWKWGAWSNWSTSPVSATDSRDVETRTTYIFKLGALGHNDKKVTLYATCTADGYVKNICQRCGRELLVSTEKKTGHNMKDDWYSWTDENGVKLERRDCHNTDRNTNTPCTYYETRPIGGDHIHDMHETARVEPKCTVDGKITYKCSDPDCDYTTEEKINKLGHDMGDWYVTKEAKCDEKGEMRRDCQRKGCDYYETKETEMKEHTVVTDEAVAAHCTKTGLTEGSHCSMCGKVFVAQETVSATDHEWGEWITVAPKDVEGNETTCGEWKKYRVCVRECGCEYCEGYEEETWHVDHNYVGPIVVDPGCVTPGYSYTSCLKCGDVQMGETIEPLGHDWGGYTRILYPTCTEEGLDQRECKRCHITEEEALPAIKHATSPLDPAYSASDDKMELVSSVKNVCGNGTVDTYQCTHIDKNTDIRCPYTVVIGNEKDHNIGEDYVTVIEPTCTTPGLKHKECQNEGCTYTKDEVVIPPLGHDLTETITKEAECTVDGEKHIVCSRGDVDKYEKIDMIGHNWRAVKIVDPLCIEDGYTYYECLNNREHTHKDNYVNAIGHNYGDWIDDGNEKTHTKTCLRDICDDSVDGHTVTKSHHVVEVDRQAATVDEEGWIKYKCTDCTYTYTETLEKVVPSPVETDKIAENVDGKAVITLTASAATSYVKVVSEKKKPVDVILVMDQSGSMSQKTSASPNSGTRPYSQWKNDSDAKVNALIKSATSFVDSIYNDAVTNKVDHRVALVGFSSSDKTQNNNSYECSNSAVTAVSVQTGLLATNNYGPVDYRTLKKAGNNKYLTDAFISVTDNKARLMEGVNRLNAYGATAADEGLSIANDIISANKNSGREMIVVFITDGVPTYSNLSNTANVEGASSGAIEAAWKIKNTQDATVYTVAVYQGADINAEFTSDKNGIKTEKGQNVSFDINRFLHAVSSNYPDATGMPINTLGEKVSNSYYMTVSNTEEFENIFDKVLVTEIDRPELFDMVTLYDTLSENVTLTYEDELKMREEITTNYGLADEDIVVIRGENETRIEFHNVKVKKVGEKYVASITFSASLNENALEPNVYDTNTEEAGVQINGETQKTFEIPQVKVDENRHIVVFTIDGKIYTIQDYNIGDKIEIPTTNLADWKNVDEIVTEDCVVYDAAALNDRPYTVTWSINGKDTVETYNFGDMIVAPENVEAPDGMVFDYWTPSVSCYMPAANVKYTAVYTDAHVHSYTESYEGDCIDGYYLVKTCACGHVEKELVAESSGHSYTFTVAETSSREYRLTCSVCGKSSGEYITVASSKSGRNQYYDLTLYNDKKEIQPNENGIIVKINMGLENVGKKYTVYRVEKDENKTVSERVTVDNAGYLTFNADHFSFYAVCPVDENGNVIEAPVYAKIYCELFGHADRDGDGYCDSCRNATADNTDPGVDKVECKHMCHSSNGFVRFIWKIVVLFCKPIGANRYCSCGAKHY